MPIFRRTRLCITTYGVRSALVMLAVVVWSWAASCVHCVKVTFQLFEQSCSPEDGCNDARNMLR